MNDKNRVSHESFGVVHLGRVSGSAQLFGSSVPHQNYISLTISKAEAVRDELHYDKIYSGEEIIRVSMSGIQLGEMLTSMNCGSGTPCTIERMFVDGRYKSIESPPPSTSTKETYVKEFKERLKKIAEDLRILYYKTEALEKSPKPTKAERGEVTSRMAGIYTELVSNLPFVQEMFNEHTEKVTQEAKGEVEAFHSAMVQYLGVQALSQLKTKELTEEKK